MITVTLGTIPISFDRIISWLDSLLEEGSISEPLFIQYGVSNICLMTHDSLVTSVSTLERADLLEQVNQSRLVIAHAGQGSTRWLAHCNKSFIIVPRLARYHEHVDDHQLSFAKSVQPLGVHYCLSIDDLRRELRNPPPPIQGELLQGPKLVDHLLQLYPAEK